MPPYGRPKPMRFVAMKNSVAITSVAGVLAGCGPDRIIDDAVPPTGQYHLEIRLCPPNGPLTLYHKGNVVEVVFER